MLFWITVAFMTAAVAIALLLPLLRANAATASVDDSRAGEVAVYRDQLQELDRDRAGGIISGDEADYARAEIGRRLLAASAKSSSGTTSPSRFRRRFAEVCVVVTLPLIGLCLYMLTGSPGLPGQPLQARLDNPGNDMGILVVKAERHLAADPQDGQGWDLLAPIYYKMGRFGDSELAFRNAIRFLGETPERLGGLAETLIAASDGIVTADARSAFEAALRMDDANPRAKFYLALALEQDGKLPEAKAAFEALAKESPADAPWLPVVNQHIAQNGGAPVTVDAAKPLGSPTTEDVANAQSMSSGDRQQMILGMVQSLEDKLKDDPKSLEGWTRLIRSYGVLKMPEKAAVALQSGLAVYPADTAEGKQLLEVASNMGLSAPGEPK